LHEQVIKDLEELGIKFGVDFHATPVNPY